MSILAKTLVLGLAVAMLLSLTACGGRDLTPEEQVDKGELSEAFTLMRDRKWYQASLKFRDILRDHPDYQEGWHNLGLCYDMLADWERAIDAYEHAISVSPNDLDARSRLHLAIDLLRVNSGARAVPLLEECREKLPRDYLVHYNLAAAYRLVRDLEQALGSINTCIEYVEDGYIYDTVQVSIIYELKAHILLDLKKPEEARRVVDKMKQRNFEVRGDLMNRFPPQPVKH